MKGIKIIGGFAAVVTVALFTVSCEKGFDYSKPEDAPTRAEYNKQVNTALQKKDSVWITDQLNKRTRNFRIGFEFTNDKNTKIFDWNLRMVTLRNQLIAIYNQMPANDPDLGLLVQLINTINGFDDLQLRDLLVNNPANAGIKEAIEIFIPVRLLGPPYQYATLLEQANTYNINGDFQTNLTFESQSILSDLKQAREFDFDFVIQKITGKELDLFGHYGSNANRDPKLIPIAKVDLYNAVNAANILNVYPGPVDLKLNGNVITGLTVQDIKTAYSLTNDVPNQKIVFKIDEAIDVTSINNLRDMVAATSSYTYPNGGAAQPSGTVLSKFYLYDGKSYNESNVLELVAR